MSEVKVSESVAAPAAKVWALLGDFGGVTKWGGSMLQSCTVEGSGVGAVRTIGLPGGLSIQERLEAFDNAGRALTYSIIGKSPIPIRNYVSRCRDRGEPEPCRLGRPFRARRRSRGPGAEPGARHLHRRDHRGAQASQRVSCLKGAAPRRRGLAALNGRAALPRRPRSTLR